MPHALRRPPSAPASPQVLYMCLGSFVLLNGLIGVFGTVFDEVADDRVGAGGAASPPAPAPPPEDTHGRARAATRAHPLFWGYASLSLALAVAEPAVIATLPSWSTRGRWLAAQAAVLGTSTALCAAQLTVGFRAAGAADGAAAAAAGGGLSRALGLLRGEVYHRACNCMHAYMHRQ